jgi:hypothetical protein
METRLRRAGKQKPNAAGRQQAHHSHCGKHDSSSFVLMQVFVLAKEFGAHRTTSQEAG